MHSFKKQEDILRFKTEKKWCGVVIQEAFIQEIQNTLEETANKKNKMIEKTRNRTNNVESLNEQAAQINSSIDALIQACNENRQRYDAQRLTFRETSERYDEKSREVKRLEGKKKRIKDDIQNLENRVTNNDNKWAFPQSDFRCDMNSMSDFYFSLQWSRPVEIGASATGYRTRKS